MAISLPDNFLNYSWEQQPGESERDFDRFLVYRDLGPARSLAQAAKTLGLTPASLPSPQNAWVERANAFDKWTRIQVTAGMRHAGTARDELRLKVFKKAIGCSEAAVDTLMEIMQDKTAPHNARVRAAGKMLDIVGYTPPDSPLDAQSQLDPVVKAKMMDALSADERAHLHTLMAKMRKAQTDHETATGHADRYPGLVPGAGLEAAREANAKRRARQDNLSREIENGRGLGPGGLHG